MNTLSRIALIAAGYTAAALAAFVAVGLSIHLTDGPDRESMSGMYAFAEAMLFVVVFSVAAIPVSGMALYHLRACPRFWFGARLCSAIATATAVIALCAYIVPFEGDSRSFVGFVSMISPVRLLASPLAAIGNVCLAVFAPERPNRAEFLAAAALEGATYASFILSLMCPI